MVQVRLRLRPVFAWYDCWIGAYYDRKKQRLYLMVPFVGVCIDFAALEAGGSDEG